MHIPLKVGDKAVEVNVLLDNGAGGRFIHPKFVVRNQLITWHLPKAIPIYNVNKTPNKAGTITNLGEVGHC